MTSSAGPEQRRGHTGSVGDVADRLSTIGGRLPSGLPDGALGVFAQFLAAGLRDAMTRVANTVTEASSPVAEPSTADHRRTDRIVTREFCR